jgi:hypothetical protein
MDNKRRPDRKAVQDTKLPDGWRVDNQPKVLGKPRIPKDILIGFQFQQHWIFRQVSNHPLWERAFDREEKFVKSIGRWILRRRPYKLQLIDKFTAEYTEEDMEAILDGWFIRHIIDSCDQRWRGSINPDGTINRTTMAEATRRLLARMLELFAEVECVDRWCFRRGQLPASSMVVHKPTPRTRNTYATPTAKSICVAKHVRFWFYQELILLRSELWDRYRLRLDQVLARYNRKRLTWQACWFLELDAPETSRFWIKRLLHSTESQMSHCSQAGSIASDSCSESSSSSSGSESSRCNTYTSDFSPSDDDEQVPE